MTYGIFKALREVNSLVDNPKTLPRRLEVKITVLDDSMSQFLHPQAQVADALLTRYSNTGSRDELLRSRNKNRCEDSYQVSS